MMTRTGPTSLIAALICCTALGLARADEASDTFPIGTDASLLSDDDLGTQRGRGGITNIDDLNVQLNQLDENAKLDHNVVYSSNTGSNSVSHEAFAGANGFATVIQNSGNNVIIQNATIVNFALQK